MFCLKKQRVLVGVVLREVPLLLRLSHWLLLLNSIVCFPPSLFADGSHIYIILCIHPPKYKYVTSTKCGHFVACSARMAQGVRACPSSSSRLLPKNHLAPPPLASKPFFLLWWIYYASFCFYVWRVQPLPQVESNMARLGVSAGDDGETAIVDRIVTSIDLDTAAELIAAKTSSFS